MTYLQPMFTLTSKSGSYTFPSDPQTYTYQPNPRKSVLRTIGGQVVQLLGYSIDLGFTGQITTKNNDKQDRNGEIGMFLIAAKQFALDMQQGEAVNLVWDSRKLNLSGALSGFDYKENLETVAYTYSIKFSVNRIPELVANNSLNSVFSLLKSDIGFTDNAGGWHGGQSKFVPSWQKIKAITGFDAGSQTNNSVAPDPNAPQTGGMTVSQAQAYAKSLLPQYGLSVSQFPLLQKLWNHESSWNWQAENPSGAYGIAQWLGSHKAVSEASGVSYSEYRSSAAAQIRWGLKYIQMRYHTLARAWAHEQQYNWY